MSDPSAPSSHTISVQAPAGVPVQVAVTPASEEGGGGEKPARRPIGFTAPPDPED